MDFPDAGDTTAQAGGQEFQGLMSNEPGDGFGGKRSMYNFLGRLMNRPESDANRLIGPLSEEGYDRRILTVIKGQPSGCFVSAVFNIGVYCVPIQGAENTKSTFSILSQLLTLKTTTGDLQLLPTIRLLPTN